MRLAARTAFLLVALLGACGRSHPPEGQEAAPSAITSARAPLAHDTVLRLAEGSFAYADSPGTRLLALEALANPVAIRTAVCQGAAKLEVTYVRRQPRGAADNGRQTPDNFEEEAGDVFRVTPGGVSVVETCYLTADSGLVAAVIPVAERPSTTCDTSWARLASTAKGRPVEHCSPLATAKGGLRIFAAQFATIDTSALASIVALDGNELRFLDLPATFTGPGEDAWRVDDGGEFRAFDLRILFAARVRGILVLGMTWAGTEGENAYLLAADSSGSFRTVSHSYRYWVPE